MKRFYIILIIIGVLVMLKPINSIIKDSINNIMFRGNVVTGIVATDNGDGSYDVFISESDRAYPKIFTLSRNPDLAIGDKVRILYKNGCKELPIILPPVKPTAPPEEYIIAFLWTEYPSLINHIVIIDIDGNILNDIVISSGSYGTTSNAITVDKNGNIYVIGKWQDKIMKLDSNGNQLLNVSIADETPAMIAVNSNNEIWTYGWGDNGYYIRNRNKSDLSVIKTYNIGWDEDYVGMAFDKFGNLYMVEWTTDKITKWDISTGTKISSRSLPAIIKSSMFSALAIVDSTIYLSEWSSYKNGDVFTCPTDLSVDFTPHSLSEFPESGWVEAITAIKGTHIICEGDYNSMQYIVKYTWDLSLIWNTPYDAEDYGLCIGAYPF